MSVDPDPIIIGLEDSPIEVTIEQADIVMEITEA